MLGRKLIAGVIAMMAFGVFTQSANAIVSIPKRLNLPPMSAKMDMGSKTFAHAAFCASDSLEFSMSGPSSWVVISEAR